MCPSRPCLAAGFFVQLSEIKRSRFGVGALSIHSGLRQSVAVRRCGVAASCPCLFFILQPPSLSRQGLQREARIGAASALEVSILLLDGRILSYLCMGGRPCRRTGDCLHMGIVSLFSSYSVESGVVARPWLAGRIQLDRWLLWALPVLSAGRRQPTLVSQGFRMLVT